MILFTTSPGFPHDGSSRPGEAHASMIGVAIFILALVAGVAVLDRVTGVPGLSIQVESMTF